MKVLAHTDGWFTSLCCCLPRRLVWIERARVGTDTVNFVHIRFGWFTKKV